MTLLGYLLAAVIGLTLGLLGAGGSILTVPVLVYVLGFAAKPAIAMSLPVVGTTSLVGAISHWRAGNVQLRTAVLFGLVAMVGSYTGARVAVFIPAEVQLILLAVIMVGAAVSMLRGARAAPAVDAPTDLALIDRAASDGDAARSDGAASGGAEARAMPAVPVAPHSLGILVVSGLGIGMLTGIVGIGGGFLIVPALVLLARVPMKQAVGTSLVVIAMNSASGALGYAGQFDLPWIFVLGFTAVAIAGILAGTWLVRFVSQGALRRGFAIFLLVLGVMILYQNRAALMAFAFAESAELSRG